MVKKSAFAGADCCSRGVVDGGALSRVIGASGQGMVLPISLANDVRSVLVELDLDLLEVGSLVSVVRCSS